MAHKLECGECSGMNCEHVIKCLSDTAKSILKENYKPVSPCHPVLKFKDLTDEQKVRWFEALEYLKEFDDQNIMDMMKTKPELALKGIGTWIRQEFIPSLMGGLEFVKGEWVNVEEL